MQIVRHKIAALFAIVLSLFLPAAAWAQANTPIEDLQTDATELIGTIATMVGALAVVALGVVAILAAFRKIKAYLAA